VNFRRIYCRKHSNQLAVTDRHGDTETRRRGETKIEVRGETTHDRGQQASNFELCIANF
jgi:hypothetical protein